MANLLAVIKKWLKAQWIKRGVTHARLLGPNYTSLAGKREQKAKETALDLFEKFQGYIKGQVL